MEFIRTIREKQQTKAQEAITKQAEESITLQDFESSLYIAHNGYPLVELDSNMTAKDIVQKLAIVRSNYINGRMYQSGLPRIAAVL